MQQLCKQLKYILCFIPIFAIAQNDIKGKVFDSETSEPLPIVNILNQNTGNGTLTDFDGSFLLEGVSVNDVLLFAYLGYKSLEIIYTGQTDLLIALEADISSLQEVVLIGYGSARKKDLTGSVSVISSKDFNKGSITTADQMLNGRSAGVRIVTSGGEPDATANIRIRGGSSLSASNNPLIVIDGVPISNNNPAGQANILGLVNPNDIESFSILKDASSTAIYGSRASNGVIIITTKAGTNGDVKYEFNSNVQIGTLTKKLDMFSSSEFVDFINTNYPDEREFLGVDGVIYDTDWQDEIYRTSFTSDNNFTVRANLFGKVPFRASAGYTETQGILKESKVDRYSGSITARPVLLDGSLKLTFNAKGLFSRKNQPDEVAIEDALSLNPTLPVFDPTGNTRFGGYYQTSDLTRSDLVTVGPTNALAKLKQRKRNEDSDRFIGNFKTAYSLPFLSELSAIVNLGLDYSESDIEEKFGNTAIAAYDNSRFAVNSGKSYGETQLRRDHTLDAYLSYAKDLAGFLRRVDAQGGYAYQNFHNEGLKSNFTIREGFRVPNGKVPYVDKLNLQSYFGRVNLNFLDKYLLTGSFRADGSSLFSEENRWGYFPAAALAWRLSEENIFKDSETLTNLKLRLGYGLTGQQDITDAAGYYPNSPLYTLHGPLAQYQIGDEFVAPYRADGFNPNLTWENTATLNAGVDFDLWSGLLSGTVDYYSRKTTDLLAVVPLPEGNLTALFISNVGSTESEGVELALNFKPIDKGDFVLQFNANAAFNETFVTDLDNVTEVNIGDSTIGRSNDVSIDYFAVGERSRTFWLFEQVYDVDGNPIQDAFVDQNNDNVINDEDRIYIPFEPKWTYGFGTNFNYKKIDFSANFRGQIGGKVYDANAVNRGYADGTIPSNAVGFIDNRLDLTDINGVYTGFITNPSDNQSFSDFYISDASFLRLDNVTLGYDLSSFFSDKFNLRLYAAVNNVFVITDYEGLDPENFDGVEESPYARPRTYTFGVNVNF